MADNDSSSLQKIGKYEVVDTLGQGAMGVVYRARDPFIGRDVALKTMLKALVEGDEERQRFFREAQAAGNLKHGNIVTIYELGMDGETAFIAMEMLEGADLKKLMREQQNLPLARKLEIIVEVLQGLDYAHKRGIVHRDIKPANIHIGDDAAVKIMDFGIARVSTSEITKTGMVLGTVSYMSPEQVAGEKVDGRSDIFAVGVILYELVTNKKPFPGDTISTIIHKIISKDPEPFTVTGLPPGVDAIIGKALAKDVAERYASAGEMASEVRAVLAGDPRLLQQRQTAAADTAKLGKTATRSVGPPKAAATAVSGRQAPDAPTTAVSASRPAPEAPARSSAVPILVGLLLVGFVAFAIVGGGAVYFFAPELIGLKGGPTPTPTATERPSPTPSESPTVETPSPTPEATPTPETTPEPTPTPTPTETPTPEATLPPLATPTPTPSPSPTAIAALTPATPPPTPKKTPEPEPEEFEPTDAQREQAGALADEGYELLMQNKFSAAEAKLKLAKKYNPGLPNAYLYLALCYKKMGKGSMVEKVMREADDNIPGFRNNPNTQMLLGQGPSW